MNFPGIPPYIPTSTPPEWGTPVEFIADQDIAPPELGEEHLPQALWPFVADTAERLGVDKTGVAMACLVSCATVATDDWMLQPKQHDYLWLENPRLWALILGDPSILKSPVIAACTKPIEKLERELRERYQEEMRAYKKEMRAFKKQEAEAAKKRAKANEAEIPEEPTRPKLGRYIVEGATTEALSEALRNDDDATQYAPAKKLLNRQDEASEFFANMDRYRSGGRGGGDRGAWLRLYNGGRHNIDRIGRGAFSIPNWSACSLGGCQPGPIQKIAKDAEDDGMLQRNMFAVPGPQKRGVDRRPNSAAIERYEALFPALANTRPRTKENGYPHPVVLAAEGHQHREYIDDLADAMAAMPDASKRLIASYRKWPGLFARLALTFHLINIADHRAKGDQAPPLDVIPPETTRRVARFMRDIILPHLLRADAMMYHTTQTGHARWIAGFILSGELDRVTYRDITRAYGALRAPECRKELGEVMMSLGVMQWVDPVEPSNPLNPVSSWLVNPAVHTIYAAKAAEEHTARERTKEAIAATVAELRAKSGI